MNHTYLNIEKYSPLLVKVLMFNEIIHISNIHLINKSEMSPPSITTRLNDLYMNYFTVEEREQLKSPDFAVYGKSVNHIELKSS